MDALSSSSAVDSSVLSERHNQAFKACLKILERNRSMQNIIAILGEGELSENEKVTVNRAKKLIKFFSQPFYTAEQFTNVPGRYITLDETIEGVEKILSGEFDSLSDDLFYMIGNIDEVHKKAEAT